MTTVLLLSGLAGFIVLCGGLLAMLAGAVLGLSRHWVHFQRHAGVTALAGFGVFALALLVLSRRSPNPVLASAPPTGMRRAPGAPGASLAPGNGHPTAGPVDRRPVATADVALPAFRGPIATPAQKRALERFLGALPQGATFRLVLVLSDAQVARLGPDEQNRLYLDLATPGSDGRASGSELLIVPGAGRDVAPRVDVGRTRGAGRLTGTFRLVEVSGPRQGVMSIVAEPVGGS